MKLSGKADGIASLCTMRLFPFLYFSVSSVRNWPFFMPAYHVLDVEVTLLAAPCVCRPRVMSLKAVGFLVPQPSSTGHPRDAKTNPS